MSDAYQTKVRPEKVQVVEEIKERLQKAQAVVLTEYRGLTVTELGALRAQLGDAQVEYKVSKNTMARIAARELGIDGIDTLTEGPTAIAYCFGDPVTGTKALTTFAQDHPALVIKGGLLEGRILSADETQGLAKVDPLEVSLGKIAGSLTAPLQAIVGVLEAPLQRIVYVLEQLAARGEAEPKAEASAEPAEEAAPAAEAAPATEDVPAGEGSEAEESPGDAPQGDNDETTGA